MAGKLKIICTNCALALTPESTTMPDIQFWIRFLSERSVISYALAVRPMLATNRLQALFTTASAAIVNGSKCFNFQINGRTVLVTAQELNAVLGLPTSNLVPDPTNETLDQFFISIGYAVDTPGQVPKRFLKNKLPRGWNFFFHVLAHSFSIKTTGFHHITRPLQKIGYAVVNNLRINYGQLVINQFLDGLEAMDKVNADRATASCLYPRFLQLLLDNLLTDEEKELFPAPGFTEDSPVLSPLTLNFLNKEPEDPLVHLPSYIQDFRRDLQVQAQIIHEQEAEEADAADTIEALATHVSEGLPQPESSSYHPGTPADTPSGIFEIDSNDFVNLSAIFADEYMTLNDTPMPPVAHARDIGSVHPQIRDPVTQPYSQTEPPQKLQTRKRSHATSKGVSASSAPNKEGSVSPSAALPLQKSRRSEPEVTASPSVFSQQDTELKKANKQSLGSASQQVDPIEIRPSARAPCTESYTESHILQAHSFLNTQHRVTHTQEVLTEATVTTPISREVLMVDDSTQNPLPSQASEGNRDSSPLIIESPSPLPGGTFLDPERDISLAAPAVDSERQLDMSTPEAIQSSNSHENVDIAQDRDLRSPIAPSVTSLEGAKMISLAGTATGSLESVRETPTEPVSVTRTLRPSDLSDSRETPAERICETPTFPNTTSPNQRILKLESEVESLKQEVSTVKSTLYDLIQHQKQIQETVLQVKQVQYDILMDHQTQMAQMRKEIDALKQSKESSGVPSQSTPHPTTLEDNPTEGEKKGGPQEKVFDPRSDKGKEVLVEATESAMEDIFMNDTTINTAHDLEEGEIAGASVDEEYVPVHVESVPVSDEVEVEEFLNEDAYDDDCLRGKPESYISPAKALHEENLRAIRKEERARRAKQLRAIDERKKDVKRKIGTRWDEARRLYQQPEIGALVNNDKFARDWFKELRSLHTDLHKYFQALSTQITSVSVNVQRDGWRILMSLKQFPSEYTIISKKFLSYRSLTELFVMRNKVLTKGSSMSANVNELLKDDMKKLLVTVGVEVQRSPFVVKYFKNDLMHTLNISDADLSRTNWEYLTYIERKLRHKGYKTTEKSEAAEMIYAYRLNRVALRGGNMETVTRQYPVGFMQPTQFGLSDEDMEQWKEDYPEFFKDDQYMPCPEEPQLDPIVEVDNAPIVLSNPLRFRFKLSSRDESEVIEASKLQCYPSKKIRKLLLALKVTTNRSDKAALQQVTQIYKLKQEEETQFDTDRVKNNPKRVIAFMFTQTLSYEFKDIPKIGRVSVLERLLERLKDPVNVLEQQAYDLVKTRLEKLPAIIKDEKEAKEAQLKESRSGKLEKQRRRK